MQRLALAERHFPALLRGEKTQTIRWKEGRPKPGPLLFYSEETPDRRAVVWVTRCTTMPLSEVAVFLGKSKDWPVDLMLTGMRRHYPAITLQDQVEVVEHLSPDETRERHPQEET